MAPSFTSLQKRDLERNQHRYYILDLQLHFFGGWSFIRNGREEGTPAK